MAKKKGRINVVIDMTPMVDVTMLLLTFFMLTTKFRPPQEAEVILPSSHAAFELPQSDVMTVSVTKDNKLFLDLDSQFLKAKMFGEENKLKSGFAVEDKQTLAELMVQARVYNPKLRTVIRGDKNVQYGAIEDVMDILQKIKITRFSLVTELESK